MEINLNKSLLLKLHVLLLLSFVLFSYGFISAKYEVFPYSIVYPFYKQAEYVIKADTKSEINRKGRWRVARVNKESKALTEEQEKALSKIAGLPYLRGTKSAPDIKNVTIYDKQSVYSGLNLVVSAHAPEASVMDMKGNILHRWRYRLNNVWPEPLGFYEDESHKTFWRRVHLFPNGDLLAIFEGIGLIKLNKDSDLLWAYKGRTHHHLSIDEKGYIYTLTRKLRHKHHQLKLTGPLLEDFVTVLTPGGKEIRSISILECFLNSNYAPLLLKMRREGDTFHTNTIELLDGRVADRIPMFKKGYVLLSVRELHTIAVVDLQQKKVIWALTGTWLSQHQPTVLESGNILLFDNWGNGGKSEVIEFNPLTQETVWFYQGTSTNELFSSTCGSNQRLPNGNTLITESDNGRAFEVTPDKEIVWEFINPNRAGENNELIATLFEVIRLDPEQLSNEGWFMLPSANQ